MSNAEAVKQMIEQMRQGRKVKILMGETSTLKDGRRLVRRLQRQSGFQLAYFQNIGTEPYVLVWRFRSREKDMAGHEVRQHHC